MSPSDPPHESGLPSPITNGSDDPRVARTMDAAANRCREGLRVVEDYTRFQRNDAYLSRQLKEIRHELDAILSSLGQDQWLCYRDTPGDVGTAISVPREGARETIEGLLRANTKRVEEALRTLEEYSKLTSPECGSQIERLRYRMYVVEQALLRTAQAHQRLAESRLYLLVTESLCANGIEFVVREAVRAKVDVIQVREKADNDRELMERMQRFRDWTADGSTLLIANDRVDIAAAAGGDGVHLGQEDLPVDAARRILGSEGLVGVSTHSREQAERAVLDGADYIGVGPVFPSHTKSFTEFAGLETVTAVTEAVALPTFAIGGIDESNLDRVLAAGARRIAVSGVVCRAKQPYDVVRRLTERLTESPSGSNDPREK